MNSKINIGVDVGSTTIKLAAVDKGGAVLFSGYERHFSNIRDVLAGFIKKARDKLGGGAFNVRVTGSGGMMIAETLKIPFVQEVVAVSDAISYLAPGCDVAIELGGEDAKILYISGGQELRMNGICAGGTGSFIDQMASLMQTDAQGLNALAKDFKTIYPIAARCGVFAKTDLQPLINEGADKSDLAASIFQAVVSQTISGLACGKPIKGSVAFLGGPLHFLPELRRRFADVLKLSEKQTIVPENSHLFAAYGAAVSEIKTAETPKTFADVVEKLNSGMSAKIEIKRLEPLFENEAAYIEFEKRQSIHNADFMPLESYEGGAFLGIDAGSTTTKMALIAENGAILHSFYKNNEGSPLTVILSALRELSSVMPKGVKILRSCVTGYGEGLIKAALNLDMGEVETVAHYAAARHFSPEVDCIIDIGGQDMKCLKIKNGVIDSVLLNEACSAGCGSFIETYALSLGHTAEQFAKTALYAENPVDLGSRCTVFMNSRIKQAQKEGASVSDIAAGLAYSVVKNALLKVIKITDPKELGENIVVQGGTFYNNAVLRAFEKIAGVYVARPNIARIMGAYGAALLAREAFERDADKTETAMTPLDALSGFSAESRLTRCGGCGNKCLLTISEFQEGRRFVSGNRCDNFLKVKKEAQTEIPNLFDYKYKRVFDYAPLSNEEAVRGTVGIPRVLNMYENYPFWHTFFTTLKYRVVLSPSSNRAIYERGMESIPSESACYPAKLVHGHVASLIESGVRFIFYPSVPYEKRERRKADNHYNCPIVTSYPENIKNNVEQIRTHNVTFKNPFLNLNDKESLSARLVEEFPDILPYDIYEAASLAWAEQERFRRDVKEAGEKAVAYIEKHNLRAIALCGRPYHTDPEIHHGIPDMIVSLGVAVLTEDSVAHLGKIKRPLIARDQWMYHTRLYGAAFFSAKHRLVELVQLNSFGCGIDAVTCDEVRDIIEAAGKIYTCLKIDEISNLGSARIRLRSLLAALNARGDLKCADNTPAKSVRRLFTRTMKKDYTILLPQMSPIHWGFVETAFRESGYKVEALSAIDKDSIETGLKYVNNDACYPALIVVGQVLNAVMSGRHDTDRLAVIISQTGGGCRASNYIGFIRRALKKAGYKHIPVISMSAGLEKNPGFKLTPTLLHKIIQAVVYGDLLMRVLYKTRPYERVKGSADALYKKWADICEKSLALPFSGGYNRNLQGIVEDFDNLPLLDIKKPKVGIVGEILVKFHPTANNDVVTALENEGAEAVVPDLLDFALYSLYNLQAKVRFLGFDAFGNTLSHTGIFILEGYRRVMRRALENSRRFSAPIHISRLAEMASPIVSTCNQTGEGWFLTAEMVELIRTGVNNIICMQPFACLPNHVTGKGVIKELKRKYPLSNIVAVDYDPGASEVNQLNRIKLMLSQAFKSLDKEVYSCSERKEKRKERGAALPKVYIKY